MKLNILPRAAGKTSDALKWMAEDPDRRVIVCISEQEAERLFREVRRQFPRKTFYRDNFTSAQSRFTKKYGRGNQVYVDNADVVLRDLFGNVTNASFTHGENL